MTTNFPKIALGAWAWGDHDDYFGNTASEADFKPVYETALSNNLNLWDTAYAYSAGASELILGNLMKETPRDQLYISTKFTPRMADDRPNPVEDMLIGSLERLKTDYVDLYWIHNDTDVEKWTPMLIPLVKSGRVKRVGVSNHTLSEIKRVQEILAAVDIKLAAVQNHYSLLDRTSEQAGILDYCQQNDITFYAYMVLEQGALTGKYNAANPFPAGSARANKYNGKLASLFDITEKLAEIGHKHRLSAAQTAMAWAMTKGTRPIIGVTKPEQVSEVATVVDETLTPDEVTDLEAIADQTDFNTVREWEPANMSK
ncbi:aldo/keto reductase [Lapidilactobacillus wuchangensis]|uniref:aldo/keto reductase n=1 Tax=Lapidilactobacillus wuchangensis TaxID=2486001 RepID=UPI000F794253|nr:aldo/keto reductase [Lapidilactobacillus wuchangensis]